MLPASPTPADVEHHQREHHQQDGAAQRCLRGEQDAVVQVAGLHDIAAIAGVDGPVYPGTCRTKELPATDNAIRLRVPVSRICFTDRVQGALCQDLAKDVGDFVLRRRDGLIAYQLAVIVDDAEQSVTHVVRGADLLDSTARQIYLQQALGLPTPSYLHIPVVTNPDGQKLSKQTLAPAITPKDAGTALLRALAFLGQPTAIHAETASPADILIGAVTSWQPEAIPGLRSMPQPHLVTVSQASNC